jgi:hypothetical protein
LGIVRVALSIRSMIPILTAMLSMTFGEIALVALITGLVVLTTWLRG